MRPVRLPFSLTACGLVWGAASALLATGWPLSLSLDAADGRSFLAWRGFGVEPEFHLLSVASEIVQIYAIFGGLVAQIIALVTMVFQPGVLDPASIQRINNRLIKLQTQLIYLVFIYIATLTSILAAKLAAPSDAQSTSGSGIATLLLGTSAFLVVFSVFRSADMAKSIISLQKLRAGLILKEAEERIKKSIETNPPPVAPDPNPAAYGGRVLKIG
jgi:hypothetical protein